MCRRPECGPATWSPPTGCTPASARRWGSPAPARRPAALRAATALRGRRPGPTWSRCTGRGAARRTSPRSVRDLVGVAVLTRERRLVRRPPGARSRRWPSGCRDAAATAVRGAGPLRQRTQRRRWPGGCCWSATPRATSTRSPARASRWRWPRARALVDCLARDRPQDYERAWRTGVAQLPGAHRLAAVGATAAAPRAGGRAGGGAAPVGLRPRGGPAGRLSCRSRADRLGRADRLSRAGRPTGAG